MLISCVCGGIFETLFAALAGMIMWIVLKIQTSRK